MATTEELGLKIVVSGWAEFMRAMKAADTATDKLAAGFDAAGKAATSATSKFTAVAKSIGLVAKDTKKALDALQPVGVALSAIGIAGVVAIKGMVAEAAAFESQAALMAIASGESGDAFKQLSDAAIKVGGDTRLVGVSASGAAESITELYKAGFTTSDVFGDLNGYMAQGAELGGVLGSSISLAAASELSMAQASDVLAIAMKTFGIETSQAGDVADNFVQTADASVTSVSELAAAMINVGPTAAAFGWSLEDVNVALALLSERGMRGSEAGTALKSMMTNLMRPTDKVKETLKNLNIELYNEQGVMKSLPVIIGDLANAMSGLSDEQRNETVQTLAGTYGMKAMNTLLAEGTAGWGEMETAVSSAANAQEIAATRAATLAGKIEAFEGTVETAKIMLGTQFIPALGNAVSAGTKLLEWFNSLDPSVQKATASILGLGTALAAGAGGFILLTPRIIATAQAASKMIPIAIEMGRGLQLLKAGASASAVASTGFSGALAVALPIIIAVTAAIAAMVAIHKFAVKIEEQHERTANAWADALERQAQEGKTATEIADEYAATQKRVNQALEESPPLLRMFIDEQQLATDSTAGLTQTLAETAQSYEEYTAASQKAAEAAGFQIDAEGDLIEVGERRGHQTRELVQENFLLSESEFAVAASMNATAKTTEELAALTDGYMDRLSEARIETQGLAASTDVLAASTAAAEAQMSALEETMGGPVGAENDKYAAAQADIRAKIDETTSALAQAEIEFGVASDEASAHRGKLGELRGEVTDLAAAHREAMNQIVFDMLTARLAADGWSQAEADLALEVAKDMGLIDADTAAAARAMNAALSDFATGEGQAETRATISAIAGELAAIPRDISIRIRITEELSHAQTAPGRLGGEVYHKGTSFVPTTGQHTLQRGEAVLPVAMANVFRQTIANSNSTTNNFNLTTNSTVRPGGLGMEFETMSFASR